MNRTKRLAPFSAKKLAKLAAAGITHPSNTFVNPDKPAAGKATARKPAKRAADTGPDQATVDAVVERDQGSCVVCGDGVSGRRGVFWSVHHRKLRSQGGDNRLSDLILTCGHGTVACHGEIHANPEKAREGGWMLLSTDDPETKPVLHSQHGWVLLDNEGKFRRTTPPHDPMVAAMPAGEEF